MMSGVHSLVGVGGGAVTGGDVTGVGAGGVDVVAMARRRLEIAKSPAGSPGGGGGGGGVGSGGGNLEGGENRPPRVESPDMKSLLKGSEEARARLEALAGGL